MSLCRSRRLTGRGRAVVLWSLALYAVAQLALYAVTDRWASVQTIHERRKWPRLRELAASRPGRPVVLMLGSSRTSWGFRAGALDGMAGPDGRPLTVYNFGVPAAGPMHEWLYLRDMLAEGIRPRLLLVEFLPPLLCEPRRGVTSEESSMGTAGLSVSQLRHLAPYLAHPSLRVREWLEARVAPWYAFRSYLHGDLQNLLSGTVVPPSPAVDEWGWRVLSAQPSSAEERAKNLAVAHCMYAGTLSRFRPGAGPCRAMRDLLELCRGERIPVALVLMPESGQFRGWYSAEAQTATAGVLADLRDRYGVGVIDAGRLLGDDDFEDGHHVLMAGADRVTALLRREIRRLLTAEDACLLPLSSTPREAGGR